MKLHLIRIKITLIISRNDRKLRHTTKIFAQKLFITRTFHRSFVCEFIRIFIESHSDLNCFFFVKLEILSVELCQN